MAFDWVLLVVRRQGAASKAAFKERARSSSSLEGVAVGAALEEGFASRRGDGEAGCFGGAPFSEALKEGSASRSGDGETGGRSANF